METKVSLGGEEQMRRCLAERKIAAANNCKAKERWRFTSRDKEMEGLGMGEHSRRGNEREVVTATGR